MILGVLVYLFCAAAVMTVELALRFALAAGGVTLIGLVLLEVGTARNELVAAEEHHWGTYLFFATIASVATGVSFAFFQSRTCSLWPAVWCYTDDASRLGALLGYPLARSECPIDDTRRLWLPILAWIGALAVVSFLRLGFQRWGSPATATRRRPLLERIIGRLVAFTVVWLGGLALFNLSLLFRSWSSGAAPFTIGGGVGLGTVASFLVRKFVLGAPRGEPGGGLKSVVRIVTPQILAYLALALIGAGIGTLVITCLAEPTSPIRIAVVCCAVLLVISVVFNPNQAGLHPFYRSRIARAYLGASNFLPPDNRQVTPHKGDDLPLGDLVTRPLHLVCTTANDLGSDPLANLNRGARSGVLSRHGFSIANRWWKWATIGQTTLASALTASGAAVNSNMGSYSTQVGSAVTFLLGSLNIRLGYWLRTTGPLALVSWLPGILFFRELFGQTRSDAESRLFHLSDGGHFENMAVYELLRRRCRYILVADCGADPDHKFEDLGNALRRAREDFAVEVEIDLAPLRLDSEKFARQYVAVGDITYPDGDRGVILLVKPVLTGRDPDDVLQYRMHNSAFPNETTGDQFYDEAQWESYRRLGQHAARSIFRFAREDEGTASALFGQARFEWYPAPPGLREASLACAARLYEVEQQMRQVDDDGFWYGVYPELPWPTNSPPKVPANPHVLAKLLPVLIQMLQLFEDVYTSCELQRLWNHPLNVGWMNCFGRWFATPICRSWWPVLSPMYNRGAVTFAQNRFGLQPAACLDAQVVEVVQDDAQGVATLLWLWTGNKVSSKSRFAYRVSLPEGPNVELGIAFVTIDGTRACWEATEFFVPPSLWGAGIGGRFLDELLRKLKSSCREVEVVLRDPPVKDDAQRKELADLMQMYRERKFEQEPDGAVIRMRLVLDPARGC